MKKLIVLIVFVVLFAMLHQYTEWKFNNENPKRLLERLEE